MAEDYQGLTPPPELVQQWLGEYFGTTVTGEISGAESALATSAARWGADQELEACCEWLCDVDRWKTVADRMRAARRPKPPTLAEEALGAAKRFYAKGHEDCTDEEVKDDLDWRALCAELVDAYAWCVDSYMSGKSFDDSLVQRARAALAQAEPEGPTDEEIMELMPQQMREDLAAAARAITDQANTYDTKAKGMMRIILNRHCVDHARAVLARWGHR